MKIDRRTLMLPALALGIGLLGVVPAFAGADEDAVAKNVEAFRVAQVAGNADGIAPLCAEELSYSHSSGAVDDKATLLVAGVKNANYKWTTLEYKNPTVRVVGPAAIVRFNFVGEQEFTDGKKTPQNLAILMNWQKQGNDWKLLSARPPEPARRPFGLARVAEEPAFQRIEAVGGGEEAKALGVAHDDSGGLRADLDDVGVRHVLQPLFQSGPITTRALKCSWARG